MTRRPVAVWLITAFYALVGAYGIYVTTSVLAGSMRLPILAQWQVAATVVLYAVIVLSALALFLMKQWAPYLFLGVFVVSIGIVLYLAFSADYLEVLGRARVFDLAISWVILGSTCWYTFRLKKQGVLR